MRRKALFMVAILLASTLVIGANSVKADSTPPRVKPSLGEGEYYVEYNGTFEHTLESNELIPGETLTIDGDYIITNASDPVWSANVSEGELLSEATLPANVTGTDLTSYGLALSMDTGLMEGVDLDGDFTYYSDEGLQNIVGSPFDGNLTVEYSVKGDSAAGVRPKRSGVNMVLGINYDGTSAGTFFLVDGYEFYIAGGRDWVSLGGIEEGETFTVGEKELTLESISSEGAIFSNSTGEEFTINSIQEQDFGSDVDEYWGSKPINIDGEDNATALLSINDNKDIAVYCNESEVNTSITPEIEDGITVKDGDNWNGFVLKSSNTTENETDEGLFSFLSFDSESNYVVVPQKDSLTASKGSVSFLDVKVAKTSHTNIGPIKIPGGSEIIYKGPLNNIDSLEELDLKGDLKATENTVNEEAASWDMEKAVINLNSENLEVNTGEVESLYTNEEVFDLGTLKDRSFILPVSTIDWENFLGVNN